MKRKWLCTTLPALMLVSSLVALPVVNNSANAAVGSTEEQQITLVIAQRSGSNAAAHANLPSAVSTYINGRASNYFKTISNNRVTLKYAGVHRYTTTKYPCNTTDVPSLTALRAEAISQTGWVAGPNKHLVIYTPNGTTSCRTDIAGSAGIGEDTVWVSNLEMWQNQTTPYAPSQEQLRRSALVHELGHNFGNGHNGSATCNTGSVDLEFKDQESGRCTRTEYGGQGGIDDKEENSGNYPSTSELRQMGWLKDSEYTLVQATSTYTIQKLSGNTGIRGLRLPSSQGGSYWIDYQSDKQYAYQIYGTSRWTGIGVHVTKRYTDGDRHVTTLRAHPRTIGEQRNLPSGSSLSIDDGRYTIKTVSESTDSATVQITVNKSVAPTPIKKYEVTPVPGGFKFTWNHEKSAPTVTHYELAVEESGTSKTTKVTIPAPATSGYVLGLNRRSHGLFSIKAVSNGGFNWPGEKRESLTPLVTSQLGAVKSLKTAPGISQFSATTSWTYPTQDPAYGTARALIINSLTNEETRTAAGATSANLAIDKDRMVDQYEIIPVWTVNGTEMRGAGVSVTVYPSQPVEPDSKPVPAAKKYTYTYKQKITLKKRVRVGRGWKTRKKTFTYTYAKTKASKWSTLQKTRERQSTRAHAKKRAQRDFKAWLRKR